MTFICNDFIFFQEITWIALVLAIFFTALCLYCFVEYEESYKENFVWFLLITFSLSTSQYAQFWPRKNALKIFLASMFFFGIHINTAYKSYLINVLTEPRYENQIKTQEMALDAKLKFEISEMVKEANFFVRSIAVNFSFFNKVVDLLKDKNDEVIHLRAFCSQLNLIFYLDFKRNS